MKFSLCAAIAGVHLTIALGALALGQPLVAGVFGIFAVVQLIGVVAQRCGPDGACDSRLVAPGAPGSTAQHVGRADP